METRFIGDVVPVTELKNNPAKVIQHATDSHRPVLLTSRGKGVAVLMALQDYEKDREKMAFLSGMAGNDGAFSVAEPDMVAEYSKSDTKHEVLRIGKAMVMVPKDAQGDALAAKFEAAMKEKGETLESLMKDLRRDRKRGR